MIQDSFNIINEMLTVIRQELSDINAQIQCNCLYIREAETCVRNLKDSETEEFKMFYPRDVSAVQKEEIERAISRKADYEEQNRELYEKKRVLESKILKLELVLKQESHNITALHVQEEDRQRIARDLHDTSLQNLSHLVHKIELCSLYIDQDPVKAKLELSEISKNMKETISEIRNTIFDLRPMTFDDLGFKAALERLLENINEDWQYEIVSDIDDVSCENDLTLLYIYRVVQEGLNNIVKHAVAKKISFWCKVIEGKCVIDIEDDGIGFYEGEDFLKEDKHFGLSLMKERVELLSGIIDISSAEGSGTKIHMEIPLGNDFSF